MKKTFTLMFCFILASQVYAQIKPQWIRYPSISPDGTSIAFTYKGDLYRVPSTGGTAQQLTFHEAHDFMPAWSKDSKQIAFASDRYGNFDIFTMNAAGGSAKRLTFHSVDEFPFSFTADNKSVLFGGVRQDAAIHRQFPTASQPELYSVPTQGGRIEQVFTIPAEYVQSSKDGSKMIYHDKKGGENEWRKHHKSSVTRAVWLYDKKTNKHQQISSFYGENRNPVFADGEQSIFYLSEEGGNFNIFKMPLKPNAKGEQVTNFKTFPVRFLSTADNGLLSFGYDGELYTLKPGQAPKKLDVIINTQDKSNNDGVVAINGGVREMSVSPDGKEVAFIARGEVFITSVDGKMTKRVTNTPEQERFVEFAPDGKSIIYSSERNGKWRIYQVKKTRKEEPYFFASTLLEEKALVSNDNDNYMPSMSPDGKRIAFIENRRSLRVMELDSKKSVTLLSPDQLFYMQDGDQYFTWSPDSKWLLATYRPTMSNGEVVLLDAQGKLPMRNLTKSGYGDGNAKWVNQGKQMIWFSNRDGMKAHANSGSSQRDVYSMFFTKDGWDRFNLSKDDFSLLKDVETIEKKAADDAAKKAAADSKDKKTVKPDSTVIFEFDGIETRKARLTIHSSNLGDAVLSKDGEKLYYLASFEKGANLWSTNLRTKETKMEIALDGQGGSLEWDKAQKNLYLLSGGRISKINMDNNKRDQITIEGEVMVNTEAEREYMFDHVWLRNKGMFYIANMHGADWDALKPAYRKYLPHIGNSYEFAEMLSELLGELNVSHSGARFSRSSPEGDATASLGILASYNHKGDGILIDEVIAGGPFDKAKFKVAKGMIIEKIDGLVIEANQDVAKYLNRKADQFTLVEILNPKTNERQQLTIKPITIGMENQLLYRRWVKINQAEVDSISHGQLGYVHIPGMSDGPYRSIYEEMMGKYADTKAVIVDTRFNGGGDLVSDLAMFFTGQKFLDYANDQRSVGYEPTFRWTKPTLAMFNEANYSDGHCFSCGYKDLGIGKTVGMPVPGTCSFAGWESLPDGTRWGSIPISAKNKAGEWLENNETKPDIQVKNMPGVIDKGKDQQLEAAIQELLKEVK
ncbi:S41 family peptidase [Pedobacter metabolipauper]|uniref:Tricorn protease homolog n=1 Tax=Pedobacter metabolipauper TaxID=425513 RepID=A0A4R6SVU9_9SPHI|nr:S41 family peptidase [Pedobacter metabolipauper]TDQ09496.1 C-terminal processing protease CtpA/Prc [Pedobacter metabolipauper]